MIAKFGSPHFDRVQSLKGSQSSMVANFELLVIGARNELHPFSLLFGILHYFRRIFMNSHKVQKYVYLYFSVVPSAVFSSQSRLTEPRMLCLIDRGQLS